MDRDNRFKSGKGYNMCGLYKNLVQTLQNDKKEGRFKSLRDVGIYWGDVKYLLPRTWPYDGPRKSPMQIYFNMRRPQLGIPMHSHHDYINYNKSRRGKIWRN